MVTVGHQVHVSPTKRGLRTWTTFNTRQQTDVAEEWVKSKGTTQALLDGLIAMLQGLR